MYCSNTASRTFLETLYSTNIHTVLVVVYNIHISIAEIPIIYSVCGAILGFFKIEQGKKENKYRYNINILLNCTYIVLEENKKKLPKRNGGRGCGPSLIQYIRAIEELHEKA